MLYIKKTLLIFGFISISLLSCKKTTEDPEPQASKSTTTTSTTGIAPTFCSKYNLSKTDTAKEVNGACNPKNPEFIGITVPTQMHSFIAYYTGLWCGPCGEYGNRGFDSLINLNRKDLHYICFQQDDSLDIDPLALNHEINTRYWGIQGLPAFTEANGLFHQAAVAGNAYLFADYVLNKVIPKAAIGLQAQMCNGQIVVKAKVKFLEDYAPTLKLHILLMEDGIVAKQALYGFKNEKVMTHNRVYRGSIIPNQKYDGMVINKDGYSATSGQEFQYKFSYKSPVQINTKNLRVLAFVWNATDEKIVEVVNSNEVKVTY